MSCIRREGQGSSSPPSSDPVHRAGFVRAAGSLKSGLALAPGPDPESASSFLRGLRLGGLVTLFVARGGPRRGIGGGPDHHAGLKKLERLADPSVPSYATQYCMARPDSAFFATCRGTLMYALSQRAHSPRRRWRRVNTHIWRRFSARSHEVPPLPQVGFSFTKNRSPSASWWKMRWRRSARSSTNASTSSRFRCRRKRPGCTPTLPGWSGWW